MNLNKKIDTIVSVFSLCIVFIAIFTGLTNSCFCESTIGTYAKISDKSPGVQDSTQKTTSSFPGFLKGRVFDNVSGAGVLDATVSIEREGTLVTSGRTTDNGTFFLQVLPGSYDVNVVRNGFFEKNESVIISAFVTEIKNINMAPTVSVPPTTPPTGNEPSSVECADGGNPSSIELIPDALTMRSGATKRVRIRVLKDEKGGCPVDVVSECIAGCDIMEISNGIITTNKRGYAVVEIKSQRREVGSAAAMFSVGNLNIVLPITITNLNRGNEE